MINSYINIGIRFVFLVLFQSLILNHVDLFGFINPYLYVLVIILLPVELNPNIGLLIALFLGLSIDMFAQSWGMHTSACVFLAFIRPYLLQLMAPRDGYGTGITPSLSYLGLNWFVSYAFIMVTLHHLVLFYAEVFRFSEFIFTLGRALASIVFTFTLVMIAEFLTYRKIRTL